MKIAILTFAVALTITSCVQNDPHGFDLSALRNAIAKKDEIVIKKFTTFSWDKVHFFGPYTTPDAIKKELGKDVPFPHSDSEGHCLIVFMAGSNVVASFEVGRSDADFSGLYRPGGYRPGEAKFTVEQTSDGWKKLKHY